jgi:hypothetical protein
MKKGGAHSVSLHEHRRSLDRTAIGPVIRRLTQTLCHFDSGASLEQHGARSGDVAMKRGPPTPCNGAGLAGVALLWADR